MPIFSCKLGSADGNVIRKDLEARNADVLRQSLLDQGFFVFDIRRKPLQFLMSTRGRGGRIETRDILMFNQELLVLLKAGLPVVQAFDTILERVDKGRLAEVLKDVREEIKGGKTLSDALTKYPKAFSHLYIASVRAGERTGDLGLTIRRYNNYLKKAEALKKKFTGALVYPAILVVVAAIAISVLLIYVVPTFSQVYADAGSALPLPTQMLISFTRFLRQYVLLFIAAVAVSLFFFRRYARTEKGRYQVDSLKLRIPVAGDLWEKYSIASFARTLSTVVGSGIPVVEGLRMSVGTLNNVVLERRLLDAVARVEEGSRIAAAFERVRLMSPLALRMLSVGETTGALEEMLGDISEYIEDEIERRMGIITTAVEPAVMIVMGIIVGVIIITMYLPVFKIAGTVG